MLISEITAPPIVMNHSAGFELTIATVPPAIAVPPPATAPNLNDSTRAWYFLRALFWVASSFLWARSKVRFPVAAVKASITFNPRAIPASTIAEISAGVRGCLLTDIP
jgi:hypothetical protein